MRNYKFSTFTVTVYLLVYTVMVHAGASLNVLSVMFILSPFLVIWLAYTILKYGKYEGPELEKDQEWGYQDKGREAFTRR